MQTRVQKGIAVLAAMLLSACGADQVTSGADDLARPRLDVTANLPAVRISEFHYNNAGADLNERVEVSFPTGTDLTGYRIVRFNGATASAAIVYTTPAIAGNASELLSLATVTACGNGRSVAVLSYPANGLQNGPNDGLALVNGTSVIELLAYGGSYTVSPSAAVAAGMVAVDIGVQQTGSATEDPIGSSLQRQADGSWARTPVNSFGSCNDGDSNGGEVGPVATVLVTPSTANLALGATQALVASASDAGGRAVTAATFTWSSSDETVATVSPIGVVTAVSPGISTITATADGIDGTATITVLEPATLPAIRFSEIHYDNAGDDFGEALEIEGPAGATVNGWQVLLYNGSGGRVYDTRVLSGAFANQCTGRGVMVLEYTTGVLQNGSPDGIALVDADGQVVEFLSYEGTFTATDGPAAGMTSRDIGVRQTSAALNTSLQRSKIDTWASAADNFGLCNGVGTRTPRTTLSFGFRTPFDPALPVGFEDLLTVTERLDGAVQGFDTPLVSETPDIAEVLPNNVIRGKAPGLARFRATTSNGFTLTYELPVAIATAGPASYAPHTEFGDPADGTPADDYLVRRDQSVVSFSPIRNTANWVAYNLEASHFGAQDRCECFTYDPALPTSFTRYSTFDYVGSGYSRGHLVKSADRTAGSLDNARTFYLSNIVPQTSANNGGPWLQLENYLSNKARDENKEVFIVTGVAGSLGTLNDKGVVTIPASLWKVAIVLPRNRGLADVNGGLVPDEVIAVIMPNATSMPSSQWEYYATTVDAVEQLSGYDLLSLLDDQIEIALESNTKPPTAKVNGPFTILAGESVSFSASESTDPDGDALTFAWTYGDGRTGEGVANTVTYTTPGTYTVTVTATDVRALFSQASTTVTVLSSAEGVAELATMIEQLGTTAKLNRGLANSLAVKVRNAGASIARGAPEAARGQLGALVNELDAFVRSGRITSANIAPVRAYLLRVIASLEFGL